MCGRTVYSIPKTRLTRVANVNPSSTSSFEPLRNYNLSSSTDIPVLIANQTTGERNLISMKWGLEPRFASSQPLTTINARVEHVRESKLYSPLIESKRCVIIVDAFYEWSHNNKERTPYLIRYDERTPETCIPITVPPTQSTTCSNTDDISDAIDTETKACVLPKGVSPLLLAGLYDVSPTSGSYSCSILTTESIGPTAKIHDRMPLLLSPETARMWLECEHHSFSEIIVQVRQTNRTLAGKLVCIEVSSLVNNASHKSIDVTLPVAEMKKRSFEKGLGRFFSQDPKKPKLQ